MSNSGSVAVTKADLPGVVDSPGVATLEEVASKRPPDGRDAGRWKRVFTKEGVCPFYEIEWKTVTAHIVSPDGETKFRQDNVEVPHWWNQTTINIVADKYFRVINGVREFSVRQVFSRVASVLKLWASEQDYFNTDKDADTFEAELIYALLHQKGAFNSPVWFNIGVPGRRQAASACFISGVDDSLDSIMEFGRSEKVIFAGGSGSGANLSSIRSSYERLSSGTYVCGPLGWMEELDKGAKAMKSGGSTRNAAKMVVMDMDHPDILETKDGRPGFIRCKAVEERRAHDLIEIGYSASYDDPNSAYKWVSFQNANHSVSIPDNFMKAVEADGIWQTISRTTGEITGEYRARELWDEISKAAWFCGDPGVQFTDTINRWHTTPAAGRIKSSNPCFHPDTLMNTEFGLVRIEDLYLEQQDSEFMTVSALEGPASLHRSIVFPTGVKSVVEVHTKNGRAIKVTPDHKIMTVDGYVEAGALDVGTRLRLQPGESPSRERSEHNFDSMWYQIAGFVVGDGWMTKTTVDSKQHREKGWKSEFDRQEVGMCFGKDDKDILAKVELFLKEADVPYSLKKQTGSIGESPDYLRIRRKAVFEMMELIAAPAGSRAFNKRLADGIFLASRQDQIHFLNGLISADGTVNVRDGGNYSLRLGSASIGLLRDVQLVLQNLGINSRIYQNRRSNFNSTLSYTTKSGEKREYVSRDHHELNVSGESLRRLRDIMKPSPLLSDRKASLLDQIPSTFRSKDDWTDEVSSIVDNGEVVTVYDMTEFDTHSLVANGIVVSNCSEFLHVDNTACNLCAVNLTKFFDDRKFDVDDFEHTIRVFVTAQNAIIAKADYPTEVIEKNSHALRPIGLNYGDLGALLMKLGYGYDSDEGRAVAARLASIMTATAYVTSSKLAARVGPFSAFKLNRDDMLSVMDMHRVANESVCSRWNVASDPLGDDIMSRSAELWDEAIKLGRKFGYSISQATLQAPLGTISFLMEMDTTGIEPSFSLVSYKSLVGGGSMKLVNRAVQASLLNLGYNETQASSICKYMEENDFIEGAPGLKPEHLPIFDCAMPLGPSKRCLSPMAHLKMMAAIQPLITCAQSKTVNLPTEVTAEEIGRTYMEGWKLGLKCIALYRDGCKKSQPLATKKQSDEPLSANVRIQEVIRTVEVSRRKSLPEDCTGHRHRFDINGHKGYIMVNEFPDGTPGEVFLRLGKSGSTMEGTINGFTQLLSIALQYGVPLDKLIRSFVNTKFEPSGFTRNPNIRIAQSIFDYLFKFLDILYYRGENSGLMHRLDPVKNLEFMESETRSDSDHPNLSLDAPPCSNCGSITRRNGSCYLCDTCGTTSGCS